MKIIVRNTEPRYLAGPVIVNQRWTSDRDDAAKLSDALATDVQGVIAGRFETWLEDA